MSAQDLTGYAVDLGGTKTAAARIVAGKVVARQTEATDRGADMGAHLDAIARLIAGLGWASGDPLGVTVTGRVTAAGMWSAVNARTLAQVADAPLGQALRARFGRAGCSNDAAATALAEYLLGAGMGADNFAYVTVSTGVGGGLVLQGRLLESAQGLAGHLGFTTSRLGDARCGSGRIGTVESVASGTAIARAAAEAGHDGADARAVFEAAASGAGWADAIIDRSARAVAELCANVAAILDPSVIAIGGSVGLAPGYLARVNAHLADEPALFRRPVVAAQLAGDGPLLGALAHARGQGR